jgi:hypothetical protein
MPMVHEPLTVRGWRAFGVSQFAFRPQNRKPWGGPHE